MSQVESAAARLKCEESDTCRSYTGTAEDLVGVSIIPDVGLLPGQPGRPKSRVTYNQEWQHCASTSIEQTQRSYAIYPRGKTRYEVFCYFSRQDIERRRAQEKIAAAIRALPGCKEQFRYRASCRVEELLSAAIDAVRDVCGYRFSDATSAAFKRAMSDGMTALSAGKIEAAPEDRALAVARITARLDPGFQRFMACAAGDSGA